MQGPRELFIYVINKWHPVCNRRFIRVAFYRTRTSRLWTVEHRRRYRDSVESCARDKFCELLLHFYDKCLHCQEIPRIKETRFTFGMCATGGKQKFLDELGRYLQKATLPVITRIEGASINRQAVLDDFEKVRLRVDTMPRDRRPNYPDYSNLGPFHLKGDVPIPIINSAGNRYSAHPDEWVDEDSDEFSEFMGFHQKVVNNGREPATKPQPQVFDRASPKR